MSEPQIVWVVYHEYREEIEEYATWHSDLEAIFATESSAKLYQGVKPYHEDSHYTFGPVEVRP